MIVALVAMLVIVCLHCLAFGVAAMYTCLKEKVE